MYKLQDFDHFRSDKRIAFKQETVDGVDVTIISYMIADTDLWQQPLALETRGITFLNSTGECISLPLNKFFNLGENSWTQKDSFDFQYLISIKEKKDGSMLVPVVINNKVFWKTKKSFFSDVAIHASEVASKIDGFNEWCHSIIGDDFTPIFEFTSTQNKVVIDYGSEPEFTLIAIRCNRTGTYQTINRASVHDMPEEIKVVNSIVRTGSVDDFIDSVKDMKHIEGFVITAWNKVSSSLIQFKVKTQWYSDNHHVMTDLRERDVAEAVLNENIDDIKALVATSGSAIDKIESIEHRVVQTLNTIISETESLRDMLKACSSRKEAAELYKNNKYFSLAIRLLDGAEPDYKKFFIKFHLKVDFSLIVIYNPTFSKDV